MISPEASVWIQTRLQFDDVLGSVQGFLTVGEAARGACEIISSSLVRINISSPSLIFDFVKQYVKSNEKNEFVCKSCSELLDLKKYVYEGTFIPELDTFQTTNLAVNQKLHEIPKYEKYSR